MDAAKGKSKADGGAHKGKGEKKDSKDANIADKEPDYVYSTTTTQPDRTLFVVDLSRLKAERDTLENALVLYRPEADLKKVQPPLTHNYSPPVNLVINTPVNVL